MKKLLYNASYIITLCIFTFLLGSVAISPAFVFAQERVGLTIFPIDGLVFSSNTLFQQISFTPAQDNGYSLSIERKVAEPIRLESFVFAALPSSTISISESKEIALPTPTPTPILPTTVPLTPVPPTPTPTEIPVTPIPTIIVVGEDIWDKIAACESGNNWSIDTGNGYFGGLQFSQGAWESVGGSGNPAGASREDQIDKGKKLQAIRGWGAWGECATKLGLK